MAYIITVPLWRDFISRQIPGANIKFASEHWLFRYFSPKVWVSGKTIWFKDPKLFAEMYQNGTLNAILGHEYAHLLQNQRNRWSWFKYWYPQSAFFVWILLSLLAWNPIYLAIGLVLHALPISAFWRVDDEIEAYEMQILVQMCELYNRVGDRKIVLEMVETLPKLYSDLLWDPAYWMMWLPTWKRRTARLKFESTMYMTYYWLSRLAFDPKISYIIEDGETARYELFLYLTTGVVKA